MPNFVRVKDDKTLTLNFLWAYGNYIILRYQTLAQYTYREFKVLILARLLGIVPVRQLLYKTLGE